MKLRSTLIFAFGLGLMGLLAAKAAAQSSSLFMPEEGAAPAPPRAVVRTADGKEDHLSPAIAKASLIAAKMAEPRKYALHDLVTIVVRESTEAAAQSDLNTNKQNNITGQMSQFIDSPILNRIWGMFSNTGLTQNPQVNLQWQNQYQSNGDYDRKDTFTTRVTAQIIDVKPNGTLVLEARSHHQSDQESLDMVITGTCRKEDIASDNTVLSTQLFDLHLDKEHKGSIHDASKKGFLARTLETIFSF